MAYDRRHTDIVLPQERRGGYLDYRLEVGRSHVSIGVRRDFEVLDPTRAAVLRAWVDCLIPARGGRPSAAEVGAAEYIDATARTAPVLRETLLRVIDRLQELAAEAGGAPLPDTGAAKRTRLVAELEREDGSGGFDMVRDFTYEAYYAHPVVLAALKRELGWDGVAPTTGSAMSGFDESLLERVKTLPPRYREVK